MSKNFRTRWWALVIPLCSSCAVESDISNTWAKGRIIAHPHKQVMIEIFGENKSFNLVRNNEEMEECRENSNDPYAKNVILGGDIIVDQGEGITGEFQGKIDYTKNTFVLTCARNLDGWQIP